ncbi:erythromycin esterase [Legionella beliardensis]|uniref:Erythromycin esterase n=1 Tax=Legionella beliardensis TaxID=91822 RepID=A0A378I3T2_9GAMM|nr:erythromycin esterase family protein [Legionella beliardensis]STX29375.1 erythromycin esterase [Legionella beliardensis]
MDAQQKVVEILNHAIKPLVDTQDYSDLIEKIGNKRFVLMGEATHGTDEFYQARIQLTKRLIQEQGFMAVAVEGDWPDAYGIHSYIQGEGHISDYSRALSRFQRFPRWMWRNTTMPPFMKWLREFNDNLPKENKIGFYGLDLYSLHASQEAVISYLMKVDPSAAKKAMERYACFDHQNLDPQSYGYLANLGIKKKCIKEALAVLMDLQQNAFEYLCQDGVVIEEDYFFAAQNARIVKDAESYYRSMFEGYTSSWNIRDRHMAETVTVLADHLEQRLQKPAKIIIWAHNSHVGDARATERNERDEINIGQLIREQYDLHAYLIGFSTYEGFVTAASDWDKPAECKKIVPGLPGSYEDLFHQLSHKNFVLDLHDHEKLVHFLQFPRLQRAIGVIYRPETERFSHYFLTRLPYQFDCLIHFDKTHAIKELDIENE